MLSIVKYEISRVASDLKVLSHDALVGVSCQQTFHALKVYLLERIVVQTKASQFADGLSNLGSIGVVFRAGADEFIDVFSSGFHCQVSQVVPKCRVEP